MTHKLEAGGAGISDPEVEEAFRTVLKWIGEDPDRDGLRETPHRLRRAFREYFAGYDEDPEQVLRKTFSEVDGYDEMIVLRGVTFESHCEHHVAPIIGRAWVGYIPNKKGGRDLEARPRGRDLLQAPADPGAPDRPDRQHHPGGARIRTGSRWW